MKKEPLKVLLNLCAFQKGYKELFSVQVKVRLAPNRAAVDDVVSRPIIMPMMSSSRFSTGGNDAAHHPHFSSSSRRSLFPCSSKHMRKGNPGTVQPNPTHPIS